MRDGGGYRRDHLQALAQRVEVDDREVRIMGHKRALLRTLVASGGAQTAGIGVPSFVPQWRASARRARGGVFSRNSVSFGLHSCGTRL